MKKSIIITKGGSVFYTREEARKASAVGEQGETEGTIRHLLARGDHQLIYFGQWRGTVLDGLVHVPSHIDGLNEDSLAREQEEAFAADVAALEAVPGFNPVAYINVAGYSPTMSLIDNPNGAQTQAAAVRYQGPMLNVIRHFKLPRIVVNNDPRSYPKDQEMSLCWPEVRPAALLDQCNDERFMTVGGRKYKRRSVWARAESWAYLEPPSTILPREIPCTVIAHAHIRDGCKQRGRHTSWENILAPDIDVAQLYNQGMRVYGAGWEHYDGHWDGLFPGKVRPNEVTDLLSRSFTCPAVAAAPGFYTGKVYVCVNAGCVPLLYGDGTDPYTWDPNGIFRPLTSRDRIIQPGDLRRIVDHTMSDYDDHIKRWRYLVKPDFTLFDSCVDDLLAGADTSTDEWFARYGGYYRV